MRLGRCWLVVLGLLAALCLPAPVLAAATRAQPGHHARGQRSVGQPHPAGPAARPQPPRLGPAVNVTLTRPGLRAALKPMRALRFSSAAAHARTLTVDSASTYQQMMGFGGAMTDSSAWLLYHQLPASTRGKVMNALFSARDGIRLNFVRVPVGASDFTVNGVPYTYDDLPGGQTDPDLKNFSIAHDQAYVIPALRQMLSVNPHVKLLASEWSPPSWMKANGAPNNLSWQGTLLPEYYQTLANYLAKFVVAYQQLGVPIWALTPQNEPNSPAPYPAMSMSPASELQFVGQNLRPALAAANLQTRIFGGDDAALSFGQQLMQGSAASDLAGLAWHCYQGQQSISQFHDQYPHILDLVSECSPGIVPYGAAEMAIDAARNWASAVNLWNIALDTSGGPVEPPNIGCPHCSGLVTVSEASHTVRYTANYYGLGQMSKFVRPGAVRIATPRWVSDFTVPGRQGLNAYGVGAGLDNVAFKNPDGGYVLICHQNADAPVTFAVAWHGERFRYRLPGRGTVTFTWRAAH